MIWGYGTLTNNDWDKLDKLVKESLNKNTKHLIYFSSKEGERWFNKAVVAYYENSLKKIINNLVVSYNYRIFVLNKNISN